MAGRDTGIYVIQHMASGRRYVGSAVSFKKRWREHVNALGRGDHHSSYLMRCWRKHGPEAFTFSVALYCDCENLLMYEQALIDFYRPEFNSAPRAGSQLGYKHRPETLAKMSLAKIGVPTGRSIVHTAETRQRISANRKGKGGGPRTPERLAKIGAAHRGRPKTAQQRARISATLTGTSTGRGALSPDQVREVRRLRATGLGRLRIAKAMGINEWAADAVIGGHAYLWVA